MLPVWGNVQHQGQPVETPATLHWSQTTTTTTTISNRYTSMGGAVKRYNIDMQETQHHDHLSTALHLPPMKTFQDKHRAYKFQVVITIVSQGGGPECCHTTASYPNLRNDCCICNRCRTTTRRRQPADTKLHRGIQIERIGVGILPFPRPPVDIMAAQHITR